MQSSFLDDRETPNIEKISQVAFKRSAYDFLLQEITQADMRVAVNITVEKDGKEREVSTRLINDDIADMLKYALQNKTSELLNELVAVCEQK